MSFMYIYDHELSGVLSQQEQQPVTSCPVHRISYSPARNIGGFYGHGSVNGPYLWGFDGLGQLKTEELAKKLKFLSLLPHFTVVSGKFVPLAPSVMDPKIYDGPENYKVAPRLQDCLNKVMKMANLRPIKVALVDLTKNLMRPEFAGSGFKEQVFVASVAKIAAMLAVFQLRQDLRAAWSIKGAKTLAELFDRVRDDWAATQRDPGGGATPFTLRGVALRGKLAVGTHPQDIRRDDIWQGVFPAARRRRSSDKIPPPSVGSRSRRRRAERSDLVCFGLHSQVGCRSERQSRQSSRQNDG